MTEKQDDRRDFLPPGTPMEITIHPLPRRSSVKVNGEELRVTSIEVDCRVSEYTYVTITHVHRGNPITIKGYLYPEAD